MPINKQGQPFTTSEILRLAHAMMYESRFNNLEEVFVLMSPKGPSHFIAGIFETDAKLDEFVAANPTLVDPFDRGIGIKEFGRYPIDPRNSPRTSGEIEICWHEWYTELICPWFGLTGLKEDDIRGYELKIVLKPGAPKPPRTVIKIPATADFISMRRSFLSRFVMPQFASSLGPSYIRALDARHKAERDAKPEVADPF